MGKRGPQPQYDFTESEYVFDIRKLMSFKTLLSKHNRTDGKSPVYYDYQFKPNSSKVTAIKRTS